MTIRIDFRLALRNILRQRRRSLIAVAAIGFGVVSMMLSVGYIEWIYWANRELATVNQLGHIQVAMPGFHEEGLADPFRYLMPARSSAIETLERQPEIRNVAPRLAFNGLISHGDSTLSFIGEGIDPDKDPSFRNLLVLQGRLPSNRDPKGIVLGAGLAANLGVQTGDTVVLLANTASGGINAIEGHVRGLISTSMKAFDDNILRIPLITAQGLLRTQGAHLWVATLRQTELTPAVSARLRADPAFKGLKVVPWTELADFYNKTVALFSRQMGVVKLIIAAIIVLSISNTMTMSVMERTVEIGTAMALGVRRQRILRLFLMEGGLLGAIGGVCGVILGYLAAQAISAIGIPMPPAPGMSRGFIAGIIITPSSVIQALLLALATTLLASIYPAWRASRLVIVDALRHNR
ncbi:MAG TPA: FtsX-like permease family protein [Thiobacillaceae bacterium]|nr:FtsX-like permease family protein [Thiobacillaceae bacterium]HNU63814.1 FtsX-like permease family protein [Thiobacillaceae bacterium]